MGGAGQPTPRQAATQQAATQWVIAPGGRRIACRRQPGRTPGVIFCGGFQSDMSGGKAVALAAHCAAQGRQFTRFDYSGHGLSAGAFEDGCIGDWAADALAVLDASDGPQLLVGSSMGAWIALLLLRRRPQRIAGLLGIAAAPDFTEDGLRAGMDAAACAELERHGRWLRHNDYGDEPCPITAQLLDEARQHLQLRAAIPCAVPVRLIHGMRDADVPWQTSRRLLQCLRGEDVQLRLIKDGGHRLSRAADLAAIRAELEGLLAACGDAVSGEAHADATRDAPGDGGSDPGHGDPGHGDPPDISIG